MLVTMLSTAAALTESMWLCHLVDLSSTTTDDDDDDNDVDDEGELL